MWPDPAPICLSRQKPLNVVCDGNSLIAGSGSSTVEGLKGDMPSQLSRLLPSYFAASGVNNLGISGQSWRQMDGLDTKSSADVDAAWNGAANNVLVCWETTNTVCNNGATAAQAISDARTYLANRLAAFPGWKILLLTTIPRQTGSGQSGINANNATMLAVDAAFKQNAAAWGAKGVIDVRCPGSPFRLPDFTPASFDRDPQIWSEALGSRIHLTNAGYSVIAQMVLRAILAMPTG